MGEPVEGRLVLFGHDPTPARVELAARSRRWRTVRAARVFAVALVATPAVALVPPHAPWALGALATGAILARRRLQERWTLLGGSATCPRCGEPLELRGPTRLREPHPVSCEACRHESALHVDASERPSPADDGSAGG